MWDILKPQKTLETALRATDILSPAFAEALARGTNILAGGASRRQAGGERDRVRGCPWV